MAEPYDLTALGQPVPMAEPVYPMAPEQMPPGLADIGAAEPLPARRKPPLAGLTFSDIGSGLADVGSGIYDAASAAYDAVAGGREAVLSGLDATNAADVARRTQARGPIYAGPGAAQAAPEAAPAMAAGQPAPPQAIRPQLRPGPQPNPRGGAAGGFRSILAKEQKQREGELANANTQLDSALQSYDAANKALVDTQAKGLEAEARGAQAQADAVEATREQVAKAQMLDEGERLLEQDAIDARQKEISSGYERVAEKTVRDRRTPGQKTMALVGVALAGIGDAMMALGGNNQGNNADAALDIVNTYVQRDADEQLRMIAEEKGALGAKERELKDFMVNVRDARAQRQYAIALKWDELGHVAQQVAANTQSELKRNAAQELVAMSAQQSEAAKVQGAQAVAQDAAERARAARDLGFELSLKQSLGGGKGKPAPAAYGLRRIAEGTDQDAKKAQEIASKTGGILASLSQLREMASRGATLSPTERQTAARRLASVTAQFNGVFGDGTAPNEAQLEQMKDVFLNPTEVNLPDVVRFYDNFLSDGETLANTQMRPYGFVLDNVDVRPE